MLLPTTARRTRSLESIRIDDAAESEVWTTVPGATIGTSFDASARETLDIVERIPTQEVSRCFMPGYGIRARDIDQRLLFEIAFCFQCENALILQPAARNRRLEPTPRKRRELVGFEADSRPAQDLLARLRSSDGR